MNADLSASGLAAAAQNELAHQTAVRQASRSCALGGRGTAVSEVAVPVTGGRGDARCRFDRRMAPADEHYDDEGYGDEGGEQSEAEAFWSTEAQQELEFRKGFEFEIHYIKALPVREEPTFVLVSCAGDADEWAMETDPAMASRLKRIQIKRKGEMALRLSGVGYMIMRPGLMVQEPGGYRAMIFDQGERIQAVRRPPYFPVFCPPAPHAGSLSTGKDACCAVTQVCYGPLGHGACKSEKQTK